MDLSTKAVYKFYEKDFEAGLIEEEELDKAFESIEELSGDEVAKIISYDKFYDDSETELTIKRVLRDHFKKSAIAKVEIMKKEFDFPGHNTLYVLHYVKATFTTPVKEI